MKKCSRMMAVILCLSIVFCTFGFISVSATDSIVTEKDYEPINPNAIFMAYDNNAKLAVRLSWVNPKAGTLKEVKVYGDSTYGENKFDTLIDTVSAPTPGAVSVYDVTKMGDAELEQGKYYTYRLVYVFDDRQTDVYVSSIATTKWNPRFLRNNTDTQSQVYITGSQAYNMPGWTQKIVKDGNEEYLKLSANVDSANGWGNISLVIGNKDGKITKGTEYNVKITYKSDSDINWGSFAFKQSENWTDVTQKITSDGNGVSIAYSGVKSFYNLCIKSIEVYTIPAEGETETLVDSYSSEMYTNKPGQPVNVATSLKDGDLSFDITQTQSWWFKDSTVSGLDQAVAYYNIYEVIDGERALRARLAGQNKGTYPVTLYNISDGKHTYEVTSAIESGLESEAKTVSVSGISYEPKNVMANQQTSDGAVGVNVSWINPTSATLNKVSIYDVNTTDGTESLLSDEIDKTPGKTVKYTHTGLTAGDIKTYRIQFDYTNRKSVEVYTSAVANTGEVKKIVTNESNMLYGAIFNSSTGTSISGMTNRLVTEGNNHYVEIKANVTDNTTEKPNFYITPNGIMKGWYKLTFKARSKTALEFDISLNGVNWVRDSTTIKSVPASRDWQTLSYNFSVPEKGNSMVMIFKDTVEGLDIDDIKIEPLSGADQVSAEQNFENIGLSSGDAFPEKVGGAMAIPSTSAATMIISDSSSWWSGEADFKDNTNRTVSHYKIYEDVNGIRTLRAELIKPNINTAVPSIKLKGLTNGKLYTYYVTCEDDKGVLESEPITVTVTPQGSIDVSEFALKDNAGTATAIKAGQTYSVSVDVENNTEKSAYVQMLAAVYDNGALKAIYQTNSDTVDAGGKKTIEIEDVQIPSDVSDKAELKCFVWNGLNSLKPLRGAKTFQTK